MSFTTAMRYISSSAATVVAVVGCLGLSTWLFGVGGETALGVGRATMKFNTAVCLLASAGTLVFLFAERASLRRVADVLAWIVFVTALATLAEYVLRVDLRIDELIVGDSVTSRDSVPGRMSAVTAWNFLAFAVAALLARRKTDPTANLAFTALSMAGLVVSLIALAGYLYGTPILYEPTPAASIALSTALSFALLFTGLLAIRPDIGLPAILVSDGAGGAFARRMLLPLAAVPPLLGWLLLDGYHAGLYDTALAIALFVGCTMLVLGAAAWAGGTRANRLDEERRAAHEVLAQSERRLGESEERYRNMVELIDIGIWVEQGGTVTYANPAMIRLVGADDGDSPVGGTILSRVYSDDRVRAADFFAVVQNGEPSVGPEEFRLLGVDGATIRTELQAIGFYRETQRHVICICRNVTAQREAESRLRHSQKMQAVGELTGGIAHDFNNLLTVVMGNLELVLPGAEGAVRQSIEGALAGAERGASLTHRLLAFSRQQPLAPERLDMNELCTGIHELIERTLGGAIEIEMRPSATAVVAFADRHQVENVLLNFAINARDAMPGGGKLTVETDSAYLDEAYASVNAEVTPGHYVMVAVTDNGSGMSPEIVERAFEPFYTTKGVGKGTGLGLSMAYGFVKQSGGHLKIYSEPGHGTTIRMYLPALDPARIEDEDGLESAGSLQTNVPRGGETILIVEDDPAIRALVVADLQRLGYRVFEAETGPQALEVLAAVGDIDLLFTDVVMPGGMTGRQLSEAIRRELPRVKTLFTSGYTQNSIVHQGRLDDGIHFLAKPYRMRALAEKIREVLD